MKNLFDRSQKKDIEAIARVKHWVRRLIIYRTGWRDWRFNGITAQVGYRKIQVPMEASKNRCGNYYDNAVSDSFPISLIPD